MTSTKISPYFVAPHPPPQPYSETVDTVEKVERTVSDGNPSSGFER